MAGESGIQGGIDTHRLARQSRGLFAIQRRVAQCPEQQVLGDQKRHQELHGARVHVLFQNLDRGGIERLRLVLQKVTDTPAVGDGIAVEVAHQGH